MDETEYQRAPAATRIREARERAGFSRGQVAWTIHIGDMSYADLEAYDGEAFTTISLDQLGRLALFLGIAPAEIVSPLGRAVPDPIQIEQVISAIEEQRRDRGESVERFSERVGWNVESALCDPQQAWVDWNVDCLQDVCRVLGIDWVRVLGSRQSSTSRVIPFVYGGYWDIPRIIVFEVDRVLYCLDCPFSEELDDYPDTFQFYRMHARTVPELPTDWRRLTEDADQIGTIPIARMKFDETRRRYIMMPFSDLLALAER